MNKNEKPEYKQFDSSIQEPLSLSYFPDEKIQIVIDGEDVRTVGYADSGDFAEKITPYLDWKSTQAFMAVSRSYSLAVVDFFNSRDPEIVAKRTEYARKAFRDTVKALDDVILNPDIALYPQSKKMAILQLITHKMYKGAFPKRIMARLKVDADLLEKEADNAELLLDSRLNSGLLFAGLSVVAFLPMFFIALLEWDDSHDIEKHTNFNTPATIAGITAVIGVGMGVVNYFRKKLGYDQYFKDKVYERGYWGEIKQLGQVPETPAVLKFRCAAESLIWHKSGPPPKYKALADSIRKELQPEPGPGQF